MTPSMFGIIAEDAGALDLLGHEARHRSGAVHRGQDREIVAGAGLAAGAPEALEGRLLGGRQERLGHRAFGELVVALEIRPHGEVVLVHPIAGRDRLRGEADDLAELQHRRPGRDPDGRHLVALRDPGARREALARRLAGFEHVDRHHDIVLRLQAERAGGRCHGDGHGGARGYAGAMTITHRG